MEWRKNGLLLLCSSETWRPHPLTADVSASIKEEKNTSNNNLLACKMLQLQAISEKNVLLNQASEYICFLNNQIIQEKPQD